jgi:hypothetical protein
MSTDGAPSDGRTTLVSIDLAAPSLPPTRLRQGRDLVAPAPGEVVNAEPFSYGYTGTHDGGALPPPRGGYYAHLLGALLASKQQFDGVMLPLVAAEKATAGSAAAGPAKRTREPDADEDGSGSGAAEDGDDAGAPQAS